MRKLIAFLFFLSLTLPACARDSGAHWFEVRTPHFDVFTDTNEKQAHRIATQFEQMRAVFHLALPATSHSPEPPIVVLALKDKKDFQTLEPAAYLAKGSLDLAGLFLTTQDKNYILLRLDAEGEHPYATVYHEYTHFLLRNASEWIPLWLNEGLAEFYQNTDIHEKEVLLGQPSRDDIEYLRQNRLIPLTTLLAVDQSSPYYHQEQKGSVFYAESWALTHFIEVTDSQKGTSRLQAYAKLLVQKQDPVTAAQQAFGDLNQFQKALNNYISQGQFMMFKMNKAITVDESTFQSHPIPTADADAIRADVLVDNNRIPEAQTLLDATLRDDPNNASAHETMGFLKYRSGNLREAKKWFGEAIKLDSKSYLAHYYYAAIPIFSDNSGDADDIEANLLECIRLNPDFAPAYDMLAMHDSTIPAKAGQAHLLNVKAIDLDPDNFNFRMNAAGVLSNQQQFEGALRVLNVATKIAKTPEQRATAEARIQQIQQFQASLAQSHLLEAQLASQPSAQPGSVNETSTITDTRTFSITTSDGRKYELRPDSVDNHPAHPTEPTDGPHHTARGVLRNVQCAYPTILTVELDQAAQPAQLTKSQKSPAPAKLPTLTLYRNDMYKVEFTVLNFTPKGDINPCTDMEGLKAKVIYSEVSDKSVAGQILSIELSK